LLLFGFSPNSGLFPPAIRFVRYAGGPLGSFLYLTRDSFVLNDGVRIQIAGINPNAQPVGTSPTTTLYNIYEGSTASQWMTNVHMFGGVTLNNAYPGIDATFATSTMQTITSQEGQGEVSFSIAPGADPSPIQLNVLNTGTTPFQGPDGLWFAGGNIPGVFIIMAQATQTVAGVSTPLACNWIINPSGSLSIQLVNRNPALGTNVAITFPDYDLVTPQGQPTPGFLISTIQYPSNFGEDGSLSNSNCGTTCSKAVVASVGSTGAPTWVTLYGGSGNDDAEYFNSTQNGVSVSGSTGSIDFPVTGSAPDPTPGSTPDVYLANFDPASGKLLNATYAGLPGMPYLIGQIANAAGDIAIGGGYRDASQPTGYVLLWQPLQNKFIYRYATSEPVAGLAFDANSNLYFAEREKSPSKSVLGGGELDPAGNPVGSNVVVNLPTGSTAGSMQLQPAAAANAFWVVYQLVQPSSTGAVPPPVWAALISPALGTAVNTRVAYQGDINAIGLTPLGNLKVLLEGTANTEVTTPDALLVAGCPNTWYFAILSPAGDLVYATYVPGTMFNAPNTAFNFSTQNESTGPPPAVISCIVSTAGRLPYDAAAPGELITITGGGFGPLTTVYTTPGADGIYPSTAGGFNVKIAGLDAPVFAVARGLIAVQVPYETALPTQAGDTLTLEVFENGQSLQSLQIGMQSYFLSLFDTGDRNNSSGLPALAALNQDGTVNNAHNPAEPGSVVTVFGSGAGILSPALETGGLSPVPPADPLSVSSLIPVCENCTVLYLGSAPGLSTGVVQINIQMPTLGLMGLQPVPIAIALIDMPGQLAFPEATGVLFVKWPHARGQD